LAAVCVNELFAISVTSAATVVTITGLPFTSAVADQCGYGFWHKRYNLTAEQYIGSEVRTTQFNLLLQKETTSTTI
jgi:hypothetical protein